MDPKGAFRFLYYSKFWTCFPLYPPVLISTLHTIPPPALADLTPAVPAAPATSIVSSQLHELCSASLATSGTRHDVALGDDATGDAPVDSAAGGVATGHGRRRGHGHPRGRHRHGRSRRVATTTAALLRGTAVPRRVIRRARVGRSCSAAPLAGRPCGARARGRWPCGAEACRGQLLRDGPRR